MDYTAAPKDSGADPRVHLGPLGLSWLSEGRPCGGGATHGAAERNWGTGSGITYMILFDIIYILLYYIIFYYYIILYYIILYYIILYILYYILLYYVIFVYVIYTYIYYLFVDSLIMI